MMDTEERGGDKDFSASSSRSQKFKDGDYSFRYIKSGHLYQVGGNASLTKNRPSYWFLRYNFCCWKRRALLQSDLSLGILIALKIAFSTYNCILIRLRGRTM